MKSGRTHREALVQRVQERLGTPELQLVVELLNNLLAECKTTLVSCEESQLIRVQAEARTYDKLLRLVTRPRMKDMKE